MTLKHYTPTYQENEALEFDYQFTIFTPVYNRADTIERVFKSLNNLTYRNFEFIIINDGSTDNSNRAIEELLKTANFKTTYINNAQNKHKMGCIFEAVDIAKGEFFLAFDSDDECTPEALQILLDNYNEIPDDIKPNISGVTALCKDQYGNLVGSKFPNQPYFSSTFERTCKHAYSGEKWGFTKTQILKNIVVNHEIFSKGYIPESLIWCLISKQGFKTKYINEIIRIYYLDTGNSISGANLERNAFGTVVFSTSFLNWFKDYYPKNIRVFLRKIYALLRASKHLNYSRKDYVESINHPIFKFIINLGWVFRKHLK